MQFDHEIKKKQNPAGFLPSVICVRVISAFERQLLFKNIYYTSLVQDFEFTLLSQGLHREQNDYFTLDEEIVEQ